jgi:gliding motility-associated lipoprotein GldD
LDDPLPLLLNSFQAAFADPKVIIALIVTAVLLLLSALIAAVEVAFFSLSPPQLQRLGQSGKSAGHKITQLLEKPKSLIATIVLSHNLVNIGVVILSESLSDALLHFPDSPLLSFILQVVVVTFFIVLVGEVIPKLYSAANPEGIALASAYPLELLVKIFSPFNFLLVNSTRLLDKRLKANSPQLSVEELSHALELTSNEHTPEEERKILEGIVEFGNTEVKEIMTSRLDIIATEQGAGFGELREMLIKTGFSRIPVYDKTLDKVTGLLVVKDLLPHTDSVDFDWKTLVRPAFYVPENKKIDDLLREFQRRKMHIAIVVDEYGGTSGLITLEDIIEEILGEIHDEFDDEGHNYHRIDANTWDFEAKIHLNDVYRIMEIDGVEWEKRRGGSDTLAGFVIEIAGRIPPRNSIIDWEGFRFTIESADRRSIQRIRVGLLNVAPESTAPRPMLILLAGLMLTLFSCKEAPVPRPKGYFRIDLPEKQYLEFSEDAPYAFSYPAYARLQPYTGGQNSRFWYNMEFDRFRATLHLSYHQLEGKSGKELEDARDLVYKHASRANAINEIPLSDKERRVYGLLYEIEGNAASPIQFYLTDSSRHFLRGALYFRASPNADSIQPVVSFLKPDIEKLMNSLRWK